MGIFNTIEKITYIVSFEYFVVKFSFVVYGPYGAGIVEKILFAFFGILSGTLSKATPNDVKLVKTGCSALVSRTKQIDEKALINYLQKLGMNERAARKRCKALVKVEYMFDNYNMYFIRMFNI